MEPKCPTCGNLLAEEADNSRFCPVCAFAGLAMAGTEDHADSRTDLFVGENSPTGSAGVVGKPSVHGHLLMEELARGGMGIVYRARQISPRRDVALKMLLPLESSVPELRQRFQQEIRALADMDHAAILPLYQAGEQDGVPFFTMKLASGGSLAQQIKNNRQFSYRKIATMLATLADGLSYAHQRGILHRDVKPGNILFDESDQAYIADFGLAKLMDVDLFQTLTQGAIGTPCYMAPEVASKGARAATASSDVYGLGAVLYELLAGKPPFRVEGQYELLKKVAEEEPEAPSTVSKGVPRDLEVICLTCLNKDPRKRYASASLLADDLRRWLNGEPITARPVSPLERLVAWARRRPTVAALTVALAVALIGGSARLWFQNQKLNRALIDSKAAHDASVAANRALNARMDFLLGSFADELEDIGKNKLISETWEKLDKEQTTDPYLKTAPGMAWRRAGVLARWAQTLLLQGRGEAALEKAAMGLALCSPVDSGDLTAEEQALSLSRLHLIKAKALTLLGRFESASNTFANCHKSLQGADTTNAKKAAIEALLQESIMWGEISASSDFGEQALKAASTALEMAEAENRTGKDAAFWSFIVLKCRVRVAAADYHASGLLRNQSSEIPADKLARSQKLEQELLSIVSDMDAREKMMPMEKESLDYRRTRRQLEFRLAQLQSRLPEKAAEGRQRLRRCMDELQQEVAGDPMSHYWRVPYAEALGEWAELQAEGDPQEALMLRRSAVAACDHLRKSGRTGRREILVTSNNHLSLAKLLLDAGENAEAVNEYQRVLEIVKPLLAVNGGNLVDQEGWVNLIDRIARELGKGSQVAAAKAITTEAISFNEAQAKLGDDEVWRWGLAKFYRDMGDISSFEGKLAEALDATIKALNIRSELLENGKFTEKTNGDTANAYESLVRLHFKRRDAPMAADTVRQALLLRQRLPRSLPEGFKWGKMVLLLEKERQNFPALAKEEITELSRLGISILYPDGGVPADAEDQKCFQQLKLLANTSTIK